tara:strand:- start:1222 stop:1650 length:429 start_codon:yes stop_codon:yes gene_type:complete
MTLVKVRAAFEKAITDAVTTADASVKIIYDNIAYTTPGKNVKYIIMSIDFGQSALQNQGASSDFYSGSIVCNIYVPKSKGTSVLSAISESVIDGITSVNASDYVDTFNCKPRIRDLSGPGTFESEDESHFAGVIFCEFSANA